MSKKKPRSPPKFRNSSSPLQREKTGSSSSQNSDSPIHWETLTETDSQKITKIRPSSWDNSDDESPLTLEGDNSNGHIYSSESHSNRKSVTTEINELKKQFFQLEVSEPETEDFREAIETSLRNDRRQSSARVRRRTKSSSSSSTVMDITVQGSPKMADDIFPHETLFDNMENIAPLLDLDSKFYLDNFFAELRRKRISKLESAAGIVNERDEEDFQEIALEDPDEFANSSDDGYCNRTSRKLSQILEVEENKKDSDKDADDYSEKANLFLKFLRKSEDSDYSPLQTARSKNDEKLFENSKEKEYKHKPSGAGLKNTKKNKHTRECLSERRGRATASDTANEVISLTAKTGTIHLNSPKSTRDVKKNNSDLHQMHHDEDVDWTLRENLKLDLMKSSENPTPRKTSRRERNSGSGSKTSTTDESLKGSKFMINIGKESEKSLKVEGIKTPNTEGKNSIPGSAKSIKDKIGCLPAEQDGQNNVPLNIKSPSLGSHTSSRSFELQDILLDQRVNTSRYSQKSDYTIEDRHKVESNRTDLPCGSNYSENSSRSMNSKSSRSSRSYMLSSRGNGSHIPSQRSDKFEPLERAESQRSVSSAVLKQTNIPQLEKSYDCRSRNRESVKSILQGLQSTTQGTNDGNECIPDLDTSEWIDMESSNLSKKLLQSQLSSRSEIIISESLDKASRNDSVEKLWQNSKSNLRKLVIIEHLDNLDSSGSIKSRSRPNSYSSEERTLLNIPLKIESDEVKTIGRTSDRNGIIEECEDTATQTLKNDSESDRRLPVINEASSEDVELSNAAESQKKSTLSLIAGGEESTHKSRTASHGSVKIQPSNESMTKPEPGELWNDLIETFSEDQNQPFNWQDNFFGFLNPIRNSSIRAGKELSSPTAENFESGGKEEEEYDDDFILSRRLTENVLRSGKKSDKISFAKKRPEKKENFMKNLDLGLENNLIEKMKTDNDVQNLYCLEVDKVGNFGIGEFGDVKCWTLDMSHAPEEGRPKGDGDGILPQYRKESPLLNQDVKEKDSTIQRQLWENLKDIQNSKVQKFFPTDDLMPFFQSDLKTSKSDTWKNTIEFSQHATVDLLICNNNPKGNQKPLIFDNPRKRKRKAASSISSMQCSSSESEENQELGIERLQRSASLTDMVSQSRRSGYEKLQSNESIYTSRSRLFEKMRKESQDKGTMNLNIFLAREREEDKTGAKFNWLILKQSRGKTRLRENKKSKSRLKIDKSLIKKDSKEYLSFRSRRSMPQLKLSDSNCFQNFYKRVISVFCLTSNSSIPTSK